MRQATFSMNHPQGQGDLRGHLVCSTGLLNTIFWPWWNLLKSSRRFELSEGASIWKNQPGEYSVLTELFSELLSFPHCSPSPVFCKTFLFSTPSPSNPFHPLGLFQFRIWSSYINWWHFRFRYFFPSMVWHPSGLISHKQYLQWADVQWGYSSWSRQPLWVCVSPVVDFGHYKSPGHL